MGHWNNSPRAGERWRRRKDGLTETRTVVDRTFGGDVCFISGAWTMWKRTRPEQITRNEWMDWQKDAKQIVNT